MAELSLPHEADAGPTKPEVRAVAISKLAVRPTDHVAEVGACTGAVTVELARRAAAVTALERNSERLDAARGNLAANDYDADVTLREAEAPDGLPEDADALFLGGSRNAEAVLDHAVETGVERIVMNVCRIETAARMIEAFRSRDLLAETIQLQVSRGYDLAGETGLSAENPVFVIVGRGGGASDELADNQASGGNER
ncbi:precorrin-6Y C5,15-methyltransferase (decarboxylating) subunit CbiT [Halalkaliarchaeum sp. AArc-GB]|uniref:precorrin-6Y C5,15-methyltransferase (decarboxylating) subunit CbiT n=1 Tax=Halalkaliarchaeum sp. AArc-GB TaxID=3074078 RepID=UPI002866043C|nr:precorrin-6Y C5,15-methyltransferase (decarboxylating) subunit CbiT [Halalkaliarchaeum sp. AArc-GB]MDR5673747.1 precorrin-6Y C5,15-methyltransferase (decarboxylating) subunit CbiT [Halalkaliarchaeum sp. AArc-GB]